MSLEVNEDMSNLQEHELIYFGKIKMLRFL